jgi:hypothetical protein
VGASGLPVSGGDCRYKASGMPAATQAHDRFSRNATSAGALRHANELCAGGVFANLMDVARMLLAFG